MRKMFLQRNHVFLPLALSGLALAAQGWAQQQMAPNANGSGSTFNADGDLHSKAQVPVTGGTLTPIPEGFSDMRLSSGVLLNVAVYDEPELATEARVDDKGDVILPLIGPVHVAGKTVAEAQIEIQNKYQSDQILKNPQVSLNVLQYVNSDITVLGEVQSPGRYPMLAPHSLLDVIGMAGGETNLAGETVEVEAPASGGHAIRTYQFVRGENETQSQSAMINPGDTVRVERAGIVYVLGAVYRPGGYVMQENGSLNVAEAVSLAQGTIMQAKISGMRVIRRQPDGTLKEIPVPYEDIMKGKNPPLVLEAQDIVYVPVSKVKTVFSTGATIVGETSSAAIYTVK